MRTRTVLALAVYTAATTLALLITTSATAERADVTGEVVGVHDGDTITLLLPEKEQVKIRLVEIDTPETKQPWGKKAKQALSEKVFGKEVRVEVAGQDRYGRLLGHIFLGARDINRELVAEGHAWVYVDYVRDRSLFDVENEARRQNKGLWALPRDQRQAPWSWRKQRRGQSRARTRMPRPSKPSQRADSGGSATQPSSGPTSAPSGRALSCGSKRRCGEMESCEEARFYLERCGVGSLDGDRDGVPCESICK